jgi:phosphoglycolate phosphatase-like HAD superfamily hydrolase
MIRCVAFDFDGTLVDSNRIKREVFFDVVADVSNSVKIMKSILLENPGDRLEVFRRFVERSPNALVSDTPAQIKHRVSALVAEYTKRCEDTITKCPEVPGAGSLLTQLRQQGIIAAIISATPVETLTLIVAKRGWSEAFRHVFGRPTGKSENLRWLALATSLRPDEIVMVGDKQLDQQAAMDFGCRFVAVIAPDNDFVTSPSHAITSLDQLVELMDQFDELPA